MKAVLILSGGVDSTTLLYKMIDMGYEVEALTFNYAQRHKKEIDCASSIARRLSVPHRIVDLRSLASLLGSSALLGGSEVPDCHYTEEAARKTVVPNRNMIMLSIAAGYAEANGISEVFYAAHKNDRTIYPDCRPEFVEALRPAIRLATAWNPVELVAPFIDLSKAEIVRIGLDLNVPYALTWSCYRGEALPCKTCPTCIERREAFAENGCRDPLAGES
jgi:7-cyano-7-deazaguanine synthase